eukprot:scaffold17413_cov55-Cyclotella_meneghiniana.AAC.11
MVVLDTIGAEIDFFQLNALFSPFLAPTNDTSTTPTMAGSLQIADPTTPNPTNTITNVSATGGGVGGINSATTAFKITAEAVDKCTNDGTEWFFTSVGKDRGRRGTQNTQENTQQSIGMRAGECGGRKDTNNTTIIRNNAGEM